MRIIKSADELQIIPSSEWYGLDLETTGLDPHKGFILLLSLATPDGTYVVDFTAIPLQEINQLRERLEGALIIGANLTFDLKWLFLHTKINPPRVSDVMLNEQLLSAGKFVAPIGKARPFSLAAIASRRLGITLDKDVREEFINYSGSLSEQAYTYAAQDTAILWEIYTQQLEEINRHNLQRVYDLECSILPITALMELKGVRVDVERLKALEGPFNNYIQKSEKIFQDLIIAGGGAQSIVWGAQYYAINSGSNTQTVEALQLCGLDLTSLDSKELVKWDLRARKAGGEELELLRSRLALEEEDIAEAIEHFGGFSNSYLRAYSFLVGARKLLNSYVLGIQKKLDGDIFRPWFKQLGARATGRYSSDAQQIPKDGKLRRLGIQESIRECIIAREGYQFAIADFSAIELVILADFSEDTRLGHEITYGDVHQVVTREVLGRFFPVARNINNENKKKAPYNLLRDMSKVVSYGIAYGVTGKSLSEQATAILAPLDLKLTPEEGNEAVDLWKKSFPEAGKFLDESAKQAVTDGYTESKLGRKRWYDLDYIRSNKWARLAAMREGSNQRIQSSSVDMTKLAQLYFYRLVDRERAYIVLTIHDELVIEAQEGYMPYAKQALKHAMETAARNILPLLGHTVVVEPSVSSRYDK